VARGDDGALLQWQKMPTGDHLLCAACTPKFRSRNYCPLCFKLWEAHAEKGSTVTAAASRSGTAIAAAAVSVEASPAGARKEGGDGDGVAAAVATTDPAIEAEAEEAAGSQDAIKCDVCRFWVHAACDGITSMQYRQLTEGVHPTLGSGYLCPVCRRAHLAKVVKELVSHDEHLIFAQPVTVEMAPTYFDIIKAPMDLATMSTKVARGDYKSLQARGALAVSTPAMNVLRQR
jgi:hypothetical protein